MNLDWLHVHQLKPELWVWHLKPLTVIGLLPAVSIWSQIVQTFTKNPEAKLQKVRNWCHWAKKKNSVAIFMTDSMNSLGKLLQIFPLDFTGSLFVTIDIYPIHPSIHLRGRVHPGRQSVAGLIATSYPSYGMQIKPLPCCFHFFDP